MLERNSSFIRKAAGSNFSANVDTEFIVCSVKEDFKLNRIALFLSLINESKTELVVDLSKEDLCDEPNDYPLQAQKLNGVRPVLSVNGTSSESCE